MREKQLSWGRATPCGAWSPYFESMHPLTRLCAKNEPGLKCLRSRETCTLQDLVMLPWSCGEPVQAEQVLSGNNQPDRMDGFL